MNSLGFLLDFPGYNSLTLLEILIGVLDATIQFRLMGCFKVPLTSNLVVLPRHQIHNFLNNCYNNLYQFFSFGFLKQCCKSN